MNTKELQEILKKHLHWILGDCKGWETMRANLCGADLCGANLCGADLCGADLCGANLCGADLCGANLYGANLYGANLYEANLYGADLCETNLYGANLRGADLRGANLRGANLREANLCGADLRGADLCGAANIPFVPIACPESGSFIGFKKASKKIVELEICEDARRSSATGRKCRCDKAKVLSITNLDGSKADILEVSSDFNDSFIYKVGEIVEEPKFCEDRFNECAKGIHFFINRQEAVEY